MGPRLPLTRAAGALRQGLCLAHPLLPMLSIRLLHCPVIRRTRTCLTLVRPHHWERARTPSKRMPPRARTYAGGKLAPGLRILTHNVNGLSGVVPGGQGPAAEGALRAQHHRKVHALRCIQSPHR